MNEPVMDMNVLPVFLILGITGEGVNITITDDGFETSHPEMENKFVRIYYILNCLILLMYIFGFVPNTVSLTALMILLSLSIISYSVPFQ